VGSRLGLDDDDEDEINVDGDDSEDGFEEDTGVDAFQLFLMTPNLTVYAVLEQCHMHIIMKEHKLK